jgi:hypothetical protein
MLPYWFFCLLLALALTGAAAVFLFVLYGFSPELLRREREQLVAVRDRATSWVVESLAMDPEESALVKGFLLGVVFGGVVVLKLLGVI